MTTLSEFSSNIRKTNIARPYLFSVLITTPSPASGGWMGKSMEKSDSGLVSMYCVSAQTPATSLFTDDSYYEAGINRKPVYDYAYQNLTLEFMIDSDYSVKEYFDNWMSNIILSRRIFNYPENYTAKSLELKMLSIGGDSESDNKPVMKYIFSNIFPKNINQINLASNSNGMATFTVDFVFETFSFTRSMNNPTVSSTSAPPGNSEVKAALSGISTPDTAKYQYY